MSDITHIPGYSGPEENEYAFKDGGYQWALKRVAEFGSICRTTYFGQDAVLLTGKQGMEIFYDASLVKRGGFSGAADSQYLGDGHTAIVPTLDGRAHLDRKSNLLKMLDDDDLSSFIPVLHSYIQSELDDWCDLEAVDVKAGFDSLGFRLMSLLAFGSVGDKSLEADYFTATAAAFRLIEGDHVPTRNRLLAWYRRELESTRRNATSESPKTMLSILAHESDMTDDEIIAETQHLFIGAAGVGGVGCDVIAQLQEQPLVFDRISDIARGLAMPLSLDSWPDDHYFQRYLEELMRVSPFINTQTGTVLKEFTLNGYSVPPGVLAVAGFYATNLNEDIFEEARRIDPNRNIAYEKQDGNQTCPFSVSRQMEYVPFGGGDRRTGHRCLGEPLVYLIMKILMTTLARDYSWDVLNSEEVENELTPHQASKVMVSFVRL